MNETVQVVNNHEVFAADRSQTDLTKVHQRRAWKLEAKFIKNTLLRITFLTLFSAFEKAV